MLKKLITDVSILLWLVLSLTTPVHAINSNYEATCDLTKIKSSGYESVIFNGNINSENIKNRRKSGITEEAIHQAKKLQRDFGIFKNPTPFFSNDNINIFAKKLLGHDINIYMKDETINPTGSFKDRMPVNFYNKISNSILWLNHNKNKGIKNNWKILAVSTGNHGRAAAYAAQIGTNYIKQQGLENNFHFYSEITMPANALSHKKIAIEKLGAKIRDHYDTVKNKAKPIPDYLEAENLVIHENKSNPEHTLLLLHADKYAINGYAVIAEEMIEQARSKGIDLAKIDEGEAMMLVPLGSGGLLSGTEEISVRYPHVYSVGVTAAPADLTYRSLKFCKMIRQTKPYQGQLIVDGVMATPELFSLERIKEVSKEVVLIQQEDAVYATALLKKNGIHIEPTSGLPLAALLLGTGKSYDKIHHAFVVLTGKNSSSEMDEKIAKLAAEDETALFNYFKQRRAQIKENLSI